MTDMTDTQMDEAPSTADATPVAKLAMVTLDAQDAAALGDFSSKVLGWPVAYFGRELRYAHRSQPCPGNRYDFRLQATRLAR